jgi:hypothetical protein
MARKLNVQKPNRQTNAVAEVSHRRPTPTAATLYLMQLRAQTLKVPPQPGRVRLDIEAEAGTETEKPEPVKIIWIT